MYNLRHNLGYKLPRPAGALAFGGAIGKALDSWYVDKDVDKAVAVFKKEFVEDPEDAKRTHVMGEWILRNYHQQYQDQPWELLHTEMTFEIPLPNGNTHVCKVDKVIKETMTKRVWGVDHKTTSQLGPTFFNMAEPNMQFTGYAYGLVQKGYNPAGMYVDAILVAKGLLPGPTKSAYLTPTMRKDIYYKQEHYDEWLTMVQKVQADIKQCEETGVWNPNWTSCVTKYGDCEFRRVCKEEQCLRQRILDADYIIEFWDPMKGATHEGENSQTTAMSAGDNKNKESTLGVPG